MPIPGVDGLEKAEAETNKQARALGIGRSSSGEEIDTNSTSDFAQEPDAHAPASFSKLMAEIGGAWRILVFMAFLASVLAFTYLILLRFFSGPIIWVSIDFFRPPENY